jgi:ribosomal protein L40E
MDTKIKIALFTGLVIILGIQGFWIFKDAERRGMKKWLWGIFGLLNTPTNLLIYLIVSRTLRKRKICYQCGHENNHNARYCEDCGSEFEPLEQET